MATKNKPKSLRYVMFQINYDYHIVHSIFNAFFIWNIHRVTHYIPIYLKYNTEVYSFYIGLDLCSIIIMIINRVHCEENKN